jgi:hypothetical protein
MDERNNVRDVNKHNEQRDELIGQRKNKML